MNKKKCQIPTVPYQHPYEQNSKKNITAQLNRQIGGKYEVDPIKRPAIE